MDDTKTKNEKNPLDEMLHNLIVRLHSEGLNGQLHQLALVLSDTRDLARATRRLAKEEQILFLDRIEQLTTRFDSAREVATAHSDRLDGEIRERSQRQTEITGRLADLERRMVPVELKVDAATDDPDRMAIGLTELFRDVAKRPASAESGGGLSDVARPESNRDRAIRIVQVMEDGDAAQPTAEHVGGGVYQVTGLDTSRLGHARATTVERTEASLTADRKAAEGIARKHWNKNHSAENWNGAPEWVLGALCEVMGMEMAQRMKARAQCHVTELLRQDLAVARELLSDVWALVVKPDGYGSSFCPEPGIDETTPAQAVSAVLANLRAQIGARDSTISNAKLAMTELYGPAGALLWDEYVAAGWPDDVERRHSGLVERIQMLAKPLDPRPNELERRHLTSTIDDLRKEATRGLAERAKLKQTIADQAAQMGRLMARERMLKKTIESTLAAWAQEACARSTRAALNAEDRQSDDDQICGA
ncbi:MAG TPA: hypothetical protein VLN57_20975 [Xanthobacteraceae bacterium]|nr:hypothetical protein [Xanthobacteraceae bacterium]